MNKSIKKNPWKKRTLLMGVAALGFAPIAAAVTGGADSVDGAYIGPLPAAWFQDEPCQTQPIVVYEDQLIKEWVVDVSGVANDGDPNTFARCTMLADTQENTCIVGLSDGTVVACEDNFGPHVLPTEGDLLYMTFIGPERDLCQVRVSTSSRFGEADPKCRDTGGGTGGTTSGGLGCNAGNSTAVVKATGTSLIEGQCYSFNKTNGTLKVGTWSGVGFNIDIEDSSMNFVSASIGDGGYTDVGGVANGTIYFKVDVPGASAVTAQLDSW